jgi:hypothetical protein
MVSVLTIIYLAGWLLVSFAAYAAGKRLTDRQRPANHRFMVLVSVAAGAIWPLLMVGLVELSSVMVLTRVPSKPRKSVGIFA